MTPGTESLCGQGEGLRRRLQQERERVLAEIHAFPPAIPAAEVSADEKARRLQDFLHDLSRLGILL
ncbi:MAG: hypothetical protein OXP68_03320 [Anaerolineaceae bacterium]|nr:hypothetical protein [Anaerolineaceae bacterium]MDE0327958.1 hypothetical protein [Anaerolineaceae bacterium]